MAAVLSDAAPLQMQGLVRQAGGASNAGAIADPGTSADSNVVAELQKAVAKAEQETLALRKALEHAGKAKTAGAPSVAKVEATAAAQAEADAAKQTWADAIDAEVDEEDAMEEDEAREEDAMEEDEAKEEDAREEDAEEEDADEEDAEEEEDGELGQVTIDSLYIVTVIPTPKWHMLRTYPSKSPVRNLCGEPVGFGTVETTLVSACIPTF